MPSVRPRREWLMQLAAVQSCRRACATAEGARSSEAAVLLWCFWQQSVSQPAQSRRVLVEASEPWECKVAWMYFSWVRNGPAEVVAWQTLEAATALQCLQPLALRRWPRWPRPARAAQAGVAAARYRKILAVLQAVEADATDGSVATFHAAVERFAMHSEGAWLKVAGGSKAAVLEALAASSPLAYGSVALELGSFIGYTAVRLARVAHRPAAVVDAEAVTVISVEGDPVHVALARHFVDLVQVAPLVEVQPGMVRDVAPLVGEAFGRFAPGFTFMDQKGTTFHVDHRLLDRLQLWPPDARVIADNVLRPGAPIYVWDLARATATQPAFWSLPEFLEETAGVEDWMAVALVGTGS